MRSLLDVNVILALIDYDHAFHFRSHEWWENAKGNGWASCPLTENGVVRIMSHPRYADPEEYKPREIISWLTQFSRNSDHEFWPDDLSLTDTEQFNHDHILGPRQITDHYLLALAVSRNAAFVTFDRSISTGAVKNALPGHLLVI